MNVISPLTILNAFFIAVSNIDHFFIWIKVLFFKLYNYKWKGTLYFLA